MKDGFIPVSESCCRFQANCPSWGCVDVLIDVFFLLLLCFHPPLYSIFPTIEHNFSQDYCGKDSFSLIYFYTFESQLQEVLKTDKSWWNRLRAHPLRCYFRSLIFSIFFLFFLIVLFLCYFPLCGPSYHSKGALGHSYSHLIAASRLFICVNAWETITL